MHLDEGCPLVAHITFSLELLVPVAYCEHDVGPVSKQHASFLELSVSLLELLAKLALESLSELLVNVTSVEGQLALGSAQRADLVEVDRLLEAVGTESVATLEGHWLNHDVHAYAAVFLIAYVWF